MTYLELIARVGTSPMDVVKMYFKGMITEKELSNVIGRNRAGIVEEYKNQAQTSLHWLHICTLPTMYLTS